MTYVLRIAAILSLFFTASLKAQMNDGKEFINVDVFGWKVFVDTNLVEGDTSILKQTMGKVGKELFHISRIIPKSALVKIQTADIYLLKLHGSEFSGAYLPLKIDSLDAIEYKEIMRFRGNIIISPTVFLTSKILADEWVMLHELAHAYHDRLPDETQERIVRVYKLAMSMNLYGGKRVALDNKRHGYASTNDHEYFAELSKIYFGRNYYFPKDRFDLKGYDPLGYKLIEELWGEKKQE